MKRIRLSGNYQTKTVTLDGKALSPAPSLALRNHSPDGFNWGYGGSGPSQLALAVLLAVGGSEFALERYHDFKSNVIARIPQEDFDIEIDINETA